MGMPTASVQQSPNQSGGKGMGSQMNAPAQTQQTDQSMSTNYVMSDNQQAAGGQNGQPSGKGGRNYTMPGQGGQPRMGQPNAYSNTIQPWDNASIQPQRQSGKGKGY